MVKLAAAALDPSYRKNLCEELLERLQQHEAVLLVHQTSDRRRAAAPYRPTGKYPSLIHQTPEPHLL